jgi:hypothetical protein
VPTHAEGAERTLRGLFSPISRSLESRNHEAQNDPWQQHKRWVQRPHLFLLSMGVPVRGSQGQCSGNTSNDIIEV